MSRRSLALALCCLVGLGVSVWLLAGRGSDEPVLARLTEVHGSSIERDYAKAIESWSSTQPGAEFRLGDGLRTGDKTSGKLHFIDASQLEVQPNTLLRFLPGQDGPSDELGIDVQSGEARLRVSSNDMRIRTHIGSLIVKSGTLMMLSREGDKLGFQVELGSVQFRDNTGAERSIESGEQVKVAIGMAVMGEPTPLPQEDGALELAIDGAGARVRPDRRSPWRALATGKHRLADGTELSLPAGARASLARGEERAELEGSGEYVLGGETALVSARSGSVSAESVGTDLAIAVPGGVIVLRGAGAGSKAGVRVGAKEGQVSVQRGSVSLNLNGETAELSAGEESSWSVSGAAAQITGTEEPEDQAGTLVQPSYFNLAAPAGESFVLHAPELPVSVSLDVSDKCPDEAEVQLSGSRLSARGSGRINVLLNRGTRSYSVRCVGGKSGRVVAKATINVLLDQGTRKLPPLPPTSLADADGRTYTLYYSNQSPALKLSWPNPPKEPSYVLEVDGKPRNLSAPEYVFKSGELGDGSHAVSFRAGTRRSRTTTIEVRFDNNAPTASVTHPADRGFAPGQAIQVSGVSLPSWKVSLNGGTIREESDGRFTGSITPTAERPDISVRLSHPRRGVHYYLRRAASSP
jgi:hypothetical protein